VRGYVSLPPDVRTTTDPLLRRGVTVGRRVVPILRQSREVGGQRAKSALRRKLLEYLTSPPKKRRR